MSRLFLSARRRALLLAACAAASPAVRAQLDAGGSEAAIKAAFLLRFAAYVEWPADSRGPPGGAITIGVLGDEAVTAELVRQAPGRRVGERPLAVRRLRPAEAPGEAMVLFLGRAEHGRLGMLQQALQSRSFLLVTESEDGPDTAGMINFVLRDRRLRFEVDLAAAEKAGLQLSSRLLGVAVRVYTGGS